MAIHRTVQAYLLFADMLMAISQAMAGPASQPAEIRSYPVDRVVSGFPSRDDLSTPEAAYATINRQMAAGTADWVKLSVGRMAKQLASVRQGAMPADQAAAYTGARILEVWTFRDTVAGVFARMGKGIDIRFFELEDGRWRNTGNDSRNDLDSARAKFAQYCSFKAEPPKRGPISDPQAHLKPFVEYLQTTSLSPKQFVLQAIAKHRLVIIGEIHHRPTYWGLNSEIVSDAEFAKLAGTIYLELPSNDQDLVDRFLSSEKVDTAPVVEMLRDNLWMGWPDRPMLDFFVAVWKTNQTLPAKDRVRIVLVDMARPWKEIHKLQDWRKYEVDRDKLMADNVLKDLSSRGEDGRHGLFIVGYAHAENLAFRIGGEPIKSAGWRLRQVMKKELYTVVQHGPVLANMGGVSGRTCLGIFDAAFAAIGDKPVGFALGESPFGKERFDANADWCSMTASLYGDAFDGYLYLGPLDQEVFSPLIEGFYTDEFVKELDRRHRMMSGSGLVQGLGLAAADGKSFAAWMGREWGRPRRWRTQLGPIDAWHNGDDWQSIIRSKQHRMALENPDTIRGEARRLLERIQKADYSKPDALGELPYRANHWYDEWIKWVCDRFGRNPIKEIDLGKVAADKTGRPAVNYTLVLADGSRMAGVLPMEYEPAAQVWIGVEGLDWHLKAATTQPVIQPSW